MRALLLVSLGISILLVTACEKQEDTEIPKITTTPPAAEQVDDKTPASVEGPDCATFVQEVRQACVERFARGLDVDCHGFITKANSTVSDGAAGGDRMCATYGTELRAAVAQATTFDSGEKCAALGKKLEVSCFAHIGTGDYPMTCAGPLIALKRVQLDLEAKCDAQLIAFR